MQDNRRKAYEALYKVIEGRKISIGPLFDPYHKRMSEEECIATTKQYEDILLFLQNELNRLDEEEMKHIEDLK
jgi:oligoendopeptidase F